MTHSCLPSVFINSLPCCFLQFPIILPPILIPPIPSNLARLHPIECDMGAIWRQWRGRGLISLQCLPDSCGGLHGATKSVDVLLNSILCHHCICWHKLIPHLHFIKCYNLEEEEKLLTDLGKTRGCFINTVAINSFFCKSSSYSPGFMAPPRPNGLRWCFQS